ncbi:MAG: hypothetical protein EB054_02230 [Actinobacteria bacterium]|jgi:hypothetical protein|nr:hypothetical protein [Actinomycetota bacterium]
MNFIISSLFGGLVAIAGIFLHNSYQPFGVIASLIALVLGFSLVKNMYHQRLCTYLYSIFWIGLVLRAATLGNGGELLVQGNNYGNLFAFGGSLLLAILILTSRFA